jgi:hypothetical protein
MPKGKPSTCLSPEQLTRLEVFREANRLSIPALALVLAAPFKWEVLSRALAGRPVWNLNHTYIVQWIDKHLVKCEPIEAPAGVVLRRDMWRVKEQPKLSKAEQRAEDYGAIGTPSKNGK